MLVIDSEGLRDSHQSVPALGSRGGEARGAWSEVSAALGPVLLLLTPVPVRRSSWPVQARRAGKEVWVQLSSGEVNTKIIVVSELRVERPSPGVASGLTAVVQLESWWMLHSFS